MGNFRDIETELLIEAIRLRYGHDYRQYQRTSLQRRFEQQCQEHNLENISDMIPLVLNDERFYSNLFYNLSVTVTEMFRDPGMYRVLRHKVIPFLRTFPYINVWHAGCATGEEAYSTAILLQEEGLLNRAQIYATDINDPALKKAARGIYPIKEMKQYTRNYNKTLGKNSLADYYHTKYNGVMMNNNLKERITFSNHNLATDGVFAEMQLVMCKNVLIYFSPELQERVLNLLTDSLCFDGFLCLGDKETIAFTNVAHKYEIVDSDSRIYQKKSQ